MMLAATVTWLAPSPLWLLATFALLGASRASDSVSGMSIILEFCAPEDRPTYVGLTNTLLAPVKASAPVVGGWLATWASYRGMFVVALTISLLGAILLALWVREPRHVTAERAQ
jgi:MFS family permease